MDRTPETLETPVEGASTAVGTAETWSEQQGHKQYYEQQR